MKDHTATIPMSEYQELMKLKEEKDVLVHEHKDLVLGLFNAIAPDDLYRKARNGVIIRSAKYVYKFEIKLDKVTVEIQSL